MRNGLIILARAYILSQFFRAFLPVVAVPLSNDIGAVAFGLAQTPLHIVLAIALIGAGCSPVLMAAYDIVARGFPAAAFAKLAGGMIGIGSIGNVGGSAPLAWAVGTFGWRASMLGLGTVCAVTAIGMIALIRDPERVSGARRGSAASA